MIETKIGIIKEENKTLGAFVMIVPDNGIPIMLGSVDEPLEIQIVSKNDLVKGLSHLPQEFLQTIDQCSEYRPENIEELQEQFAQIRLIE